MDSQAAPWSIRLEVRVAGRLDECRQREAFGRALAAPSDVRSRKVASDGRAHQYHWEIGDGIDVDPLRALDCADDPAVAAAQSGCWCPPT